MSVSGRTIHGKIKEKLEGVEAQHKDLSSRLFTTEDGIERLTARREECYGTLAEFYLPELEAAAVKATLAEVREEVERVFRAKQERRQALERLMNRNRDRNSQLEAEIEKLGGQIGEKDREREAVVKAVTEELSHDEKYTVLDSEAKKAEGRLQQNRQRVAQIEEEAKQKLPEFERNKIFRYLLGIGYGTAQYHGGGLRGRLDSWVAEKVNFGKNKECYDFLRSMPELMKQEVERRQSDLDGIVKKMKKIEAEAAKRQALPEIQIQIRQLSDKKQELAASDRKQDEQYAEYVAERERIDGEKDPYHIQAVQNIKKYFKGQKITELRARARQTESEKDDRTVDEIESIDTNIRTKKDEAKRIRYERDEMASRLDALKRLEGRFVSKDYEGSYSYFPDDFDVGRLLTAFMLGRMSVDEIGREVDSAQFTRTPTYHSSGGYSSSDSDSSGGGFGGDGGFSSGGGFGGGGGFSSGGGF